MPTGYTSDLYDGKDITFPDFALQCARAFGALITMRDDPMDAPIPDKFEPSSYHADAVAKAEARLIELETITGAQLRRGAEREYETAHDAWLNARQESQERRKRYEAMLEQVRAWTPPTDEHVGLRDFMEQQLAESIRFDCSMEYYTEPTLLAPGAWHVKEIQKAQRDLDYHRAEDEKERERAAQRTAWVRALRESLPVENVASDQ